MANTIKPKRSSVAGNIPTILNISQYEIAMNTADKKIFTSDGTNIIQLAAGDISGLGDVQVSSPENGQSLTYDSVSGKWVNTTNAATQSIITTYKYTATEGQTVFTGADDESKTLHYYQGATFLTLNGVFLEDGSDYVATNGTSIILSTPTSAGDDVNVYCFANLEAANVYAVGDERYVQSTGSFTDNSLVRFDSTTGKLIQASLASLDDDGRLTNVIIDSITNKIGADHIHFKIKATEALVPGNVVKVIGYNSGEDAYEVAKVLSSSDVAIGLCHDTLSVGQFGSIVNTGLLEGFDTSAFSVGTILYPNTTGGLTSVKPTTGTYQAIAFVLRSHAINGAVLIEATEPNYVQTSDNSANALVLRDSSGNFSAGTITATLNGNASTATNADLLDGQDSTYFATASGLSSEITNRINADATILSSANAYTDDKVAALVNTAPATLDTLNELALALGNDANFSTSVTNSLAGKQATLVSGTNIKTVNGTSILGSGNIQIDGGVTSFNTRTGAVTLTSSDVTTALGFTPYNSTNPNGYITSSGSISGNAATATTATNVNGGTARISGINGVDQMIENNYGAYLHIGNWGVGRTDPTAVLVNTAYRSDISDYASSAGNADTVDGYHASAFLRDIGTSLSSSGYTKLSNGLIIQWATVGRGTNNFPIAFPSACLSLGFSVAAGDNNAFSTTELQMNVSTTQITLVYNRIVTYRYIAIGY